MKAIILAGGQGGRFWPLSSEEKPKQFLNLYSNETMIQQTYQRFRNWLPADKVFVVTTEKYLPLLIEQLPEIEKEQIILEPEQKDTAPCIAITALYFLNKQEDEVLVLAPSDQYIDDSKSLRNALSLAEDVAISEKSFVTLGVTPKKPETGYGYIQTKKDTKYDSSVFQVETFIEKPDIKTAEKLIKEENVFWNSGILICKPSTISANFSRLQADMWKLISENQNDLKSVYPLLPKVSIDYAILEKADAVYTIPVNFIWDDLGVWTGLERIQVCDNNNNLIRGEVMTSSTQNCIVYTDRKTILIGVEDLIVASTENGLVVCHKSKEQQIKKIINQQFLKE
ncbi:sugar phosphate nucleotidyltransferase [Peribacillus simplex]|uniref:mannose-1-phosphate guanylyltransferase n=1 Tax=Peribacillus simplex TaxID=1478 RepID=UPI00203FD1CE|nr:sugar phosphate nucleotidyltransferase [Peribacillus simplex]MCM3676444.1 sugar phosphate nucleotidyltransferase [Peribacillus simplex]